MPFLFFKKKTPFDGQTLDAAVEAQYLIGRERTKAVKLARHIDEAWGAPEAASCEKSAQDLLQKYMPSYALTSSLQEIRSDFMRGLFCDLPAPVQEDLRRLCLYGNMVKGFTHEMSGAVNADPLFEMFEKARHSRLFAYHLFRVVDNLEIELVQCTHVAMHQFVLEALLRKKLIKPGTTSWPTLTRKEKLALFDNETLMSNLQRLSVELASIMVYEMRKSAAELQCVLQEREKQKEPLAFEQEAGLGQLQKKIQGLKELVKTQDLHHFKNKLLSTL